MRMMSTTKFFVLSKPWRSYWIEKYFCQNLRKIISKFRKQASENLQYEIGGDKPMSGEGVNPKTPKKNNEFNIFCFFYY